MISVSSEIAKKKKKNKLRKLIAANLILYPNKNMILLVWKIQEDSICRPISVEEFVGLHRGCPALQEEGASPPALPGELEGRWDS